MTQTVEIKDAEKQIYRLAVFEDGIWEIFLGVFFTLMSFYSLTRELLGPILNSILFLGAIIVLSMGAVIAKYHIILPRSGRVSFSTRTKKKRKTAVLILIGIFFATIILMILGGKFIDPIFCFGTSASMVSRIFHRSGICPGDGGYFLCDRVLYWDPPLLSTRSIVGCGKLRHHGFSR